MRSSWKFVVLLAVVALSGAWLVFEQPAEAPEQQLPVPARQLREQLEAFTTLRVFMSARIERFPSRFIVHMRDDQKIMLDGPGNLLRYSWLGPVNEQQGLWSDQYGGSPPRQMSSADAGLILSAWNAIRSGRAVWTDRDPSYYDLSPPTERLVVEVGLPGVIPAGHHLFVVFGHQPPVPRRIDIYGPAGHLKSLLILGIEFNPQLPAQAFEVAAPPFAIPFPDICDGQICPDAVLP